MYVNCAKEKIGSVKDQKGEGNLKFSLCEATRPRVGIEAVLLESKLPHYLTERNFNRFNFLMIGKHKNAKKQLEKI